MSIRLPCGHNIDNFEDEVHIRVKSEAICMFDGVVPSVGYTSVCKACYEERSGWEDYLINTDEECDMNKLIIQEHKSSSYAPRTYHNASVADITVAIALEFNTAGEKLTKKAAGDKYIHFDLRSDPVECARLLYKRMKRDSCKTINVAGNGVYTCQKYGWTQEKVNLWLLHLLSPIHQHIGIDCLYSGGQTGLDIAAGVCSVIMDIPCTMTLPKGYKMRFEDGKDIEQSQQDVYNYIMKMVEEIT